MHTYRDVYLIHNSNNTLPAPLKCVDIIGGFIAELSRFTKPKGAK